MLKKLFLYLIVFIVSVNIAEAQWINYTSQNTAGMSATAVFKIIESKDGLIWLGTDEGVFSYNSSSNTWKKYENPPNLIISDILEDKYNNIWAATSGGVSRYDGIDWRYKYTTANGLPNNIVMGMTPVAEAHAYIAVIPAFHLRFVMRQLIPVVQYHAPVMRNALTASIVMEQRPAISGPGSAKLEHRLIAVMHSIAPSIHAMRQLIAA